MSLVNHLSANYFKENPRAFFPSIIWSRADVVYTTDDHIHI